MPEKLRISGFQVETKEGPVECIKPSDKAAATAIVKRFHNTVFLPGIGLDHFPRSPACPGMKISAKRLEESQYSEDSSSEDTSSYSSRNVKREHTSMPVHAQDTINHQQLQQPYHGDQVGARDH